jgi:RNA polymerase sigma factor (sigma-70 family)
MAYEMVLRPKKMKVVKTEYENKIIQFHNYLLNLAYKFTNNKEDAKDLVQEVYYKVFAGGKKDFSSAIEVRNWLSVILQNIFIDGWRKRKGMRFQNINEKEIVIIDKQQADYKIIISQLIQEVDDLPTAQREALKMRISGYSYKEMEGILNKSSGTMKSNIFHGRQKLLCKGLN